jgi:hypothetical protein
VCIYDCQLGKLGEGAEQWSNLSGKIKVEIEYTRPKNNNVVGLEDNSAVDLIDCGFFCLKSLLLINYNISPTLRLQCP